MIGNEDSVQLSEYCFNVCEVLRTAVRVKNMSDPNGSMRKAVEDLGRYVD